MIFMGIDVQVKRGCCFVVIDDRAEMVDSGWLEKSGKEAPAKLRKIAIDLAKKPEEISIGIDAPRMPLDRPRENYWEGKNRKWRKSKKNDKGAGRHCEVVIKSCGIANPQWTPVGDKAPEWMKLGFRIYNAFSGWGYVYEVFPSASYKLLAEDRQLKVKISFSGVFQGPKDILDACVSAATVREYMDGNGSAVGGGDGLGQIILPRKHGIPSGHPILSWPCPRS